MNRRTAVSLLPGALYLAGRAGTARAAAEGPFTAYDAASFKALLASGAPIIVHVHAVWCPTCKAQMPTLLEMAADPAFGAVKFVRVDFDQDLDFLKAYRVPSQSFILVMKGGKEVTRFAGVTNPAQIRQKIGQALA